ncbi:unnamed protein product [Blepharisma stoltei]|uniref:PH domain-containing protein n=1 Tax=Blepharisma stoltei TaxID=1481888 RepID=A0AAU9J880_9CILI|nr:unnamed protein product [Blepharisma stoltei]
MQDSSLKEPISKIDRNLSIELKTEHPLLQLLSPELKKILTSQKSVSLYHSKWHKKGGIPSLFPGKIIITKEQPEFIQWTWPHELHKNMISLYDIKYSQSKKSGFLQDSAALDILVSFMLPKNPVSPSVIIAIVTGEDTLIVIFEDEEACKKWKSGLRTILSLIEPSPMEPDAELTWKQSFILPQSSLDSLAFGYMFDFSEPNPPNESWRELKVTFVNEDESSHYEYLVYDRNQENLYDSLNEILGCIETHINYPNREMMKEFLQDITRWEIKTRNEKIDAYASIKNKSVQFSHYKGSYKRRIRDEYLDVDEDKLSKEIVKEMKHYEKFDYGDRVTDAFQLIFMQKLAIGLETHIVAKESKNRRKQKSKTSNPVTSKEKQESGTIENSQVEIEEKLDAIMLKRTETHYLEEENNEKVKEKGSLQSFRDACECIIF